MRENLDLMICVRKFPDSLFQILQRGGNKRFFGLGKGKSPGSTGNGEVLYRREP